LAEWISRIKKLLKKVKGEIMKLNYRVDEFETLPNNGGKMKGQPPM
jgi:hypothetical protein